MPQRVKSLQIFRMVWLRWKNTFFTQHDIKFLRTVDKCMSEVIKCWKIPPLAEYTKNDKSLPWRNIQRITNPSPGRIYKEWQIPPLAKYTKNNKSLHMSYTYKGDNWKEGECDGCLYPADALAIFWGTLLTSPGIRQVAETHEPQERPGTWDTQRESRLGMVINSMFYIIEAKWRIYGSVI